jgi:hypothetical protein
MKPNINSINVHSKLNHNVHPMDDALTMLVLCCKMGNLFVPGFCTFHKINIFCNLKKRIKLMFGELKDLFCTEFQIAELSHDH